MKISPDLTALLLRCLVTTSRAAVALPLLVLVPAFASEVEKKEFWQLTLENDLFYNQDRFYTNGIQVMWQDKLASSRTVDFLKEKLCSGCSSEVSQGTVKRFGQLMYTPRVISREEAQPDDRPWAGFLYFGEHKSFYGPFENSTSTIGYQVGVVGPASLAKQAQRAVHHWGSHTEPRGWRHQLKNEPGIILSYAYDYNPIHPGRENFGIAAWLNGEVFLGNVMSTLGVSAKVAIGKGIPPLVSQKIKPMMRPELKLMTSQPSTPQSCALFFSECYVYAIMEGQAVARNLFLDGNTFRNQEINITKKRGVRSSVLGARIALNGKLLDSLDGWHIEFYRTYRSSDFTSRLGAAPSQRFAALTIGRSY